jgi:pyruvate,water dikinase
MAQAPSATLRTFPEDWHANLPPGQPFTLDTMHFPFPVSPLTSSMDTDGFLTALREFKVPIVSSDSIIRNHYRFGRMVMAEPTSAEEAARLFGPSEEVLKAEVGRLLDRWETEHLPAIKGLLERLDLIDPDLDHLGQAAEETKAISNDLWTIHFRIAVPMLLSMQLFDEFFADLFDGTDADSHALLVGQVSESIKAGFGLADLARDATSLGLEPVFRGSEPGELLDRIKEADNGAEFLTRLDAYLDQYGYRQDLFDYATPTWKEDPSLALAVIGTYIQNGRDPRAEHAEMVQSAESATAQALAHLAAYPEAVRGQFEAMLHFGRAGAFLQEEHNFYIDQLGTSKIRLVFIRAGQKLVDAGLIDQADDVMMLTVNELGTLSNQLGDPDLGSRLRNMVETRRQELVIARTLDAPLFLGDTPPAAPELDNPVVRGTARFWGVPVEQSEDPSELRGMAGSKGRVTGFARVARSLDEAGALQPGEILVAVTTMPPWTPLFGIAGGVVTESGGPLSHCAIVAREYGIPAVVGTAGATRKIMTGQRITVDGNSGSVTIEA